MERLRKRRSFLWTFNLLPNKIIYAVIPRLFERAKIHFQESLWNKFSLTIFHSPSGPPLDDPPKKSEQILLYLWGYDHQKLLWQPTSLELYWRKYFLHPSYSHINPLFSLIKFTWLEPLRSHHLLYDHNSLSYILPFVPKLLLYRPHLLYIILFCLFSLNKHPRREDNLVTGFK